jgi:hypothetical protein
MSSSASGVSMDWELRPLQNVSIVTPNDGVIEEQNKKINTFKNKWLISIASNIDHYQQTQAGGRMFYEH